MKEQIHVMLTIQEMITGEDFNCWIRKHARHLTVSIAPIQQVNASGMSISKNVKSLLNRMILKGGGNGTRDVMTNLDSALRIPMP